MNAEKMKLIKKQQLSTGTVLSLYDHSKKIAGDRWFVQILCIVELPLQLSQSLAGQALAENCEAKEFILAKLKEPVTHTFKRERNFVAEDVREEIVKEIVSHIETSMLGYFESESLARNMITAKITQWRQQYGLAKQQEENTTSVPDDDGPADFSACFR